MGYITIYYFIAILLATLPTIKRRSKKSTPNQTYRLRDTCTYVQESPPNRNKYCVSEPTAKSLYKSIGNAQRLSQKLQVAKIESWSETSRGLTPARILPRAHMGMQQNLAKSWLYCQRETQTLQHRCGYAIEFWLLLAPRICECQT
jgi:hypothetical protein